ncbi:MAG: argininosuccinate lyase, partial [Clostridiales bacterium]|nr:argininosuccinate lyase [Clostridiales bacterium]
MNYRTGHFDKKINPIAETFNSSLSVDKRLYKEDIEASIAHAEMLGKCGIISLSDAENITSGLISIRSDIDNGILIIKNAEDIHMFVETELTRRIGDAGKKLHTARSRNDQVATDFKLFARKACVEAISLLLSLNKTLLDIAEETQDAVMPGFTHLQKAQPITAAHHTLAYAEMFFRDITRFI